MEIEVAIDILMAPAFSFCMFKESLSSDQYLITTVAYQIENTSF